MLSTEMERRLKADGAFFATLGRFDILCYGHVKEQPQRIVNYPTL